MRPPARQGEDDQTDDIEKALGELAALTARRDLTEADDVMSELQPLAAPQRDGGRRRAHGGPHRRARVADLRALRRDRQSAEAVTVESGNYFSERTDGR